MELTVVYVDNTCAIYGHLFSVKALSILIDSKGMGKAHREQYRRGKIKISDTHQLFRSHRLPVILTQSWFEVRLDSVYLKEILTLAIVGGN
jgi:hypothetical protein